MQRELSHYKFNKLCVMVSLVCGRCGFEPRSGQTKDYKIGICCFSANHAALRRKSKDWLARNQDNVSEWGDMLFQWANTIKIQHVGLGQSGPHHHHLIENWKLKFSPWYSWKIAELVLNNNHSLTHFIGDYANIGQYLSM